MINFTPYNRKQRPYQSFLHTLDSCKIFNLAPVATGSHKDLVVRNVTKEAMAQSLACLKCDGGLLTDGELKGISLLTP